MSLLDKLKKNSTIKSTQILSDSDFFNGSSLTNVGIPAIDIALSGSRYGGLPAGLTIVAGPRAHFKTNLCLKMVAAYLNKYDDAVCVFLDCEFGTTPGYLKSMGVSPERVLHVPIHNIEEMKFETVAQLENIDKGDHVIFLVDSIGNMASKKELEDAKEQKSVTDMSRAKAFKSLFRMITPYLTEKNIPMLCIGHVYETQEMFSKTILSGGCVKAGTLVTMANGALKPIEQIAEGEFVKTLDGDKEVEHTWTPDTLDDGTPECMNLEFDDGFTITCSVNHKFLTSNRGWVEAQHLLATDDVVTYQG